MVIKEDRPIGNSAMILKTDVSWRRGLDNLLRGELVQWFRTRTWWVQIIIWAASVNFIFLMIALTESGMGAPDTESVMIFNIFLGLAGPIGVSILMQNAILGERLTGTAAWVLSKPVSRFAFVLSKLMGNTLGVTVTMVLAQGLIAYLIAGFIIGFWLPVPGFLAALGVHLANIFFYLTLTLMLGTIYERPAPVIGIPIAFLFAQNFLASYLASKSATLANLLPYTLAIPLNNSQDLPLSMALMIGGEVTTYLPLISALAFSALFVAIGLWVFQRQEL